jgi:hypothetical protein
METCISQRPTDEESPESRMREIRPSGLMRGGEMNTKTDNYGQFKFGTSSLRPLYHEYAKNPRSALGSRQS